ncbi:MAG TPA: sensor histidine kinase [Tepidisphaeraceae bacterium]|jgi:signal transduction histidine kinase|nr:sensor histidine kinase [Tepidisphaeraceae bacterium]
MIAENLTLDLLETRAFPTVGAAVRSRADRIMMRWEQAVRRLLPAADEMTLSQVRDHVPAVLDRLALALESDQPNETETLRDASRFHGEARFHQHYNVRELIIEYRLLRRIVVEEIHAACGGELSVSEMVVLDMGVDTALQQGLLAFIENQRQRIQQATEAESKYLRFLSHDLRNNLGQVTLLLQLLGERLTSLPEFADDVVDIHSAQRTIMETINGMEKLLQAERLRKGAIQPRAEATDLHSLAEDAVRQSHAQAQRKGLTLEVSVPADASVVSDREVISLVLQNLLNNAVKYSSTGVIRITASPWAEEGAGGWALSVIDQGPGIARDQMARLFDAFARGETHGQSGVGLGLTIASQAAKLLGGRLNVTSEVCQGSTFSLLLPVSRPLTEPRQPVMDGHPASLDGHGS